MGIFRCIMHILNYYYFPFTLPFLNEFVVFRNVFTNIFHRFFFSFNRRETAVCKVFAFSFSQRTLGNGVCCYFVFDFSCLRTFLTSTPFSMLSSVWWIRLEKSTLTTAFSIRLS